MKPDEEVRKQIQQRLRQDVWTEVTPDKVILRDRKRNCW